MKAYIYGKPQCPNCDAAKALCEQQGIDYDYLIVGKDLTVEELIAKVGSSVRSVPQIFVSNDGFHEYVGGLNGLRTYLTT